MNKLLEQYNSQERDALNIDEAYFLPVLASECCTNCGNCCTDGIDCYFLTTCQCCYQAVYNCCICQACMNA